MPPLLSYSIRLGLAALLLLGLAAAHVADYARLIEPPAKKSAEPTRITRATVDEAIDQYIKGYTFDAYRNVFERSNFEVNPPPPPPKPKPVKIVKPEPPPPPPPPPPKPKPFTANLEVTGIAITPERKLVMVWDKNRKETHVLAERERIQRWRVVSIDKQRVVLRHPLGGRYEFIVNEETLVDLQD
jgi:outer membrane biosynthesis protein TonB